jgi:hypothetical protein
MPPPLSSMIALPITRLLRERFENSETLRYVLPLGAAFAWFRSCGANGISSDRRR